jgi:Icc-related predicted phosphoesterase
MKLLYASDIHVNRRHVESLLDVAERERLGAVVIGGDIVPKDIFGAHGINKLVAAQRKYLERDFVPVLEKFRKRNASVAVFLDLANDDFFVNRDILEAAENEGVFHLLHNSIHPLTDELDIVGYMAVPITPFGIKDWEKPDKKGQYPPIGSTTHGWVSTKEGGIGLLKHTINVREDPSIEEELARLEKRITEPFLFVCHAPPYMTNLDVLYTGEHVGSVAVREFVEKFGPLGKGLLRASFHGHIHESPNVSGSTVDYVAGVECWNPGQEDGNLRYVVYEIRDIGHTFR